MRIVWALGLVWLGSAVAPAVFGEGGYKKDAFVIVDKLPKERAVLNDGRAVEVSVERVWRPICGSDLAQVDFESFARSIEDFKRAIANEPVMEFQSAQRGGGGIDIVFNVIGSIPSQAQAALLDVEAYLEAQFTDPVSVPITFRMQSMGAGILGGTSSSYLSVTYPTVRDNIRAGMDFDDTIQDWLPDTDTIPVRYDASSAAVTDETRVFVTRANFNATIGSSSGTAASMTMNIDFGWDYDPSNGVGSGLYDFQSVLVHEVGHALGFTSGVDFRTNDIEMLDLYRFQRTDGAGDYNPDDLVDFQTTPRTADLNNPNDDVNSDLISAEYRMEDGNPRQASHFRDNLGIGIMDPTLGSGQTFFPDFFRTPDLAMFDAIGWDYIECGGNPELDDLNENGVADICERNPPTVENSGISCASCGGGAVCIDATCYVPKNRYLSIVPANPGSFTALRVRHVASGAVRWIGEPDGNGYAPLVADPEFRDWSGFALVVHASGCFIAPDESYEVQSLLDIDDPLDEGFYSAAVTVPTVTLWGDVTGGSGLPDFSANFADITALVNCFKETSGSLPRERCDLSPQSLDGTTNFTDITSAVGAFNGDPYPFAAPDVCP